MLQQETLSVTIVLNVHVVLGAHQLYESNCHIIKFVKVATAHHGSTCTVVKVMYL